MDPIKIAGPQVEIDEAINQMLQQQSEQCTIVHCRYFTDEPTGVRIWPSAFLIEEDGVKRSLIKAFNISIMPQWTFHIVENEFIRFTLVFEGLSKQCTQLYLLEDIPQPNGFYSELFLRNTTDVYTVAVFC